MKNTLLALRVWTKADILDVIHLLRFVAHCDTHISKTFSSIFRSTFANERKKKKFEERQKQKKEKLKKKRKERKRLAKEEETK